MFKPGAIVKEKSNFAPDARYKVLHCWFEGETGNTYVDVLYLATKYRLNRLLANIFELAEPRKKFKDSPYV